MDFEPGEAPGGAVVLSFAGDADLRIEVECLDAILADVSDPWAPPGRPATTWPEFPFSPCGRRWQAKPDG